MADDGGDCDGRGGGATTEAVAGAEREGQFLLGWPTFEEMGNGRFRCVETGHELPSKNMTHSYGRSKGCRLALIDAALARKTPPLNMFKPDPLSKSKLICKLTGDTINKSEEHIWKHMTGKRFQKKLEQKEGEIDTEMTALSGVPEEKAKRDKKKAGKVLAGGHVQSSAEQLDRVSNLKQTIIKKNQTGDSHVNGTMYSEHMTEICDSEEPDFWVPPVGSRWDFDNGKDRWEMITISGPETDDDVCKDTRDDTGTGELSIRTKRMSLAVGPSSFASRKKKSKKSTAG